MNFPVLVDRQLHPLAILDTASDICWEQKHNELNTAEFSLAREDPRNDLCAALTWVHLWDGKRPLGLYRISGMPTGDDSPGGTMTYSLEHVLALLLDDVIFRGLDLHDMPLDEAIRLILAQQSTPYWTLGECAFDANVTLTVGNETLLSAIQKACALLPEDYTWDYNTGKVPFVLNIRRADQENGCGIHFGRNLVGVRKQMDASQLITRLYLLGGSDASGQQVTVESLTEGGVPYIDADTIDTWGVKAAIYQSGDLVTPEALLARGREVLEARKNPCYTYEATALDLYQLTGYEWDRYEPGKRVLVMDDERGIHFAARIVSVSKRDVRGDPGSITITIANQPRDELGTVTAIAQKAQQVETHTIRNTMEMRGINDRVTTIDGTVSYLTHTAEGLRHAISTNTGTLAVLENTLAGMQSQVQDGAGNLSSLTNTVAGMANKVTTIDGTVSNLSNTAEGLRHDITDNTGKLAVLENTINGMRSDVADGAGNLSSLTNTVAGMANKVTTIDGTVSNLSNTAEGLRHDITDNTGKLAVLENTINGMRSDVADGAGNLSSLTNTVAGMANKVTTIDGTVSNLSNTAEGLRHDITDSTGKLAVLENTINGMRSDVADGAGNLSSLTNTLEGMDAKVTDIDGRTSQFRVQIGKIEGTVYDENGSSRIAGLVGRVDIEAQRNDGQDSTINLKADKTYVDKLIADEIKAMRGDFNNLTSGVTSASSLYTNSLGCQYGRITNLEVGSYAAPWQSLEVVTGVTITPKTSDSYMFYGPDGSELGRIKYVYSVKVAITKTTINYLGSEAESA